MRDGGPPESLNHGLTSWKSSEETVLDSSALSEQENKSFAGWLSSPGLSAEKEEEAAQLSCQRREKQAALAQ